MHDARTALTDTDTVMSALVTDGAAYNTFALVPSLILDSHTEFRATTNFLNTHQTQCPSSG